MDLLDNKYQIEQLLGQGGMGAVYRATHLGTKRTVAVKVIQPQLSAHDQFVARFRREAEAAVAALKRRWRVFAVTSLLVMTLILLGSVLFVIPGLIAATVYGLYGPVVIVEQHGVRDTLRRSRTLTRRALGTVLVITLIQFALPILIGKAAVSTDITFHLNDDYSPKEFGFNFSMSGGSVFAQLLNVFVTPLTAILVSLLYLKTRRAGGESLRDASDQFETLDIPRSKWQARMKTRWTNTHSPTSNR